jgi:TRAP-type mannitol/chloroaromatic compound transport system permease large subunit
VTIQIIRYAKSKGFTVNQLGKFSIVQSPLSKLRLTGRTVHAAIYVSALLDNPSVAEDALLVCMGSINVRDRLRAPFNARFAFPGCCLAGTPVIVPVSVAQGLEGQAQLDAVANVIKQEYARQKAHAALLSSSAQLIDILLAVAKTNPYVYQMPSQVSSIAHDRSQTATDDGSDICWRWHRREGPRSQLS